MPLQTWMDAFWRTCNISPNDPIETSSHGDSHDCKGVDEVEIEEESLAMLCLWLTGTMCFCGNCILHLFVTTSLPFYFILLVWVKPLMALYPLPSFPPLFQDCRPTGSPNFLPQSLPEIINALAAMLACVILDIRAALWRVDDWGGGRKGRLEERMDERWIRKGWMGTSCCNLSAFSPSIGSLFALYSPVSHRLSPHSPAFGAIRLILTYVSLTYTYMEPHQRLCHGSTH